MSKPAGINSEHWSIYATILHELGGDQFRASCWEYLGAAVELVPEMVRKYPSCVCCHDMLIDDSNEPVLCIRCHDSYEVYSDGYAFCSWHPPPYLECPHCGDVGAEGIVMDGQALDCGCPGHVSVDAESDPYIVIDEDRLDDLPS